MNALGDAALDYAARGFAVLPVKPGGKVPLVAHGLLDATTDADQVREWWQKWPTANIALRTGDAFHVLDVDPPDGFETLRALVAAHGRFPAGPRVRTPRDGLHVYLAPSSRARRNRAGFRSGLDWRADGGYVVAPPSVGANGRAYEWIVGVSVPLPAVPAWLLGVLNPPRPSPPRRSVRIGSRYTEVAFGAEVHEVQSAVEGCRNHTLVRAAFSLGTLVGAGLLDEVDVEDALVGAACSAGLSEREARSTCRSGLRAGMERPREATS